VPSKKDISFGMLRQDSFCIDTLGHTYGGSIGMYPCHSSGGNQVHCATLPVSLSWKTSTCSLKLYTVYAITTSLEIDVNVILVHEMLFVSITSFGQFIYQMKHNRELYLWDCRQITNWIFKKTIVLVILFVFYRWIIINFISEFFMPLPPDSVFEGASHCRVYPFFW